MFDESTAEEQYAKLCESNDERLSRSQARTQAGRNGYLKLLERIDQLGTPEWKAFATRSLNENQVVV